MNHIHEDFISTVSHELRTPLTSIRGFSQTLLNSWDKISDDDKKKFIGIIQDQSNRLINLVENILSVSKANAEKQVLKKVDINNSIKKIFPLFTEQYKTHKFTMDLCKNNPCARVDEDKLQQILTNLIDNAAKYSTPNSEVQITTSIIEDYVKISIKDQGVGIREEDFPRIFQKFSRLENVLTSKTQGNGLGLYITKQLIEEMGGTISFSSTINKGTTFVVSFKLYNQEEALRCSQLS